MLEKAFKNEELGIKINSYIDKQQNVWFKGKDVAQILGYRDTDDAVRRYVSIENKMTQFLKPKCSPGKTPAQQNDTKVKCSPGKTPAQQNDTKVNCSPGKTPAQQNDTKVKCSPPETGGQQNDTRGKYCTFINETGFYELVFGSKLEFAKKFRQWVFTEFNEYCFISSKCNL